MTPFLIFIAFLLTVVVYVLVRTGAFRGFSWKSFLATFTKAKGWRHLLVGAWLGYVPKYFGWVHLDSLNEGWDNRIGKSLLLTFIGFGLSWLLERYQAKYHDAEFSRSDIFWGTTAFFLASLAPVDGYVLMGVTILGLVSLASVIKK